MAQKEREEIDIRYKWNLSDLYTSLDEWREAKGRVAKSMAAVTSYKGRLSESPQTLLEFLTLDCQIHKELSRIAIYASLLSDQDVANADNMALVKEIEQVGVDYSQLCSFVRPEMASVPAAVYEAFLAAESGLRPYRMTFDRILRGREHTLSDAEEALMSKVAIMGNAPYDAFCVFSDAEMPWPTVTLSDGSSVEVDHTMFAKLRASACRADRETAFRAFWNNYHRFEGTFGELMNGNIRRKIFSAKARKFDSCLDAALHENNIPTAVYRSLIDNVNRNLPTFHRYLTLKRRLLGVDQLKYSDLYAPAADDVDMRFTYEEAQQLVLEALRPLGDDYVAVVRRAFDERWIDVLPNRGKASGAYSNGAAYDVHPYILMNFDGLYDHVGTLIHELGHTMQSYYSNLRQPYALHDYSIFVAEVASTFNEALLDHIMLQRISDTKQKICLLMNMLDGFKGTLFRQTQFAEFQLRSTEMAEAGMPITGKALSQLYAEITRRYYGHDAGVCFVDDAVSIEWAFIPHFYMGFYVYQYSTSFVASQALSEMILAGGTAEHDAYMRFLAAGDSKYPIEELKDAGVDMLSSQPFDKAMAKMNALMDMIDSLL